jgi:hypothetical protein
MGRILRRAAILASLGVLLSGGAALAWEGNGNNNGWDNKHERGCPSDYALVSATTDAQKLTDLNGDLKICTKISGNSGANYIDNISNH